MIRLFLMPGKRQFAAQDILVDKGKGSTEEGTEFMQRGTEVSHPMQFVVLDSYEQKFKDSWLHDGAIVIFGQRFVNTLGHHDAALDRGMGTLYFHAVEKSGVATHQRTAREYQFWQ